MAIIAENKPSKTFELPTDGVPIQGVLAEVRDLGLVDQTYNGVSKKVHKVLFRWQLAELDANKEPKRSYERFTLSLHEKAGLRKRLKQMYGKDPGTSFDVEKCVGFNGNLVFSYSTSPTDPTKKYANIDAILRLPANTPKLEIVKIDPPKTKDAAPSAAPAAKATGARPVTEADPIDENDLPF